METENTFTRVDLEIEIPQHCEMPTTIAQRYHEFMADSYCSQLYEGPNPNMARKIYGFIFLMTNFLTWMDQDYGHSPLSKLELNEQNRFEKNVLQFVQASIQELHHHKQRQVCIETGEVNTNSLLDCLRSLEPDMVTQLSHLSSAKVEEVSQQLVQNVLKIFFPDDIYSNIKFGETDNITKDGNLDEMDSSWSPFQAAVPASHDYLARLFFWCTLSTDIFRY